MNPSNIVCWNVHGLDSRARQHSDWDLIKTILTSLSSEFDNHLALPSVGTSSGVLNASKHNIGPDGAHRTDSFSASVQFCPNNTIYGSQHVYVVHKIMIQDFFPSRTKKSEQLSRVLGLSWGMLTSFTRKTWTIGFRPCNDGNIQAFD